MKNRKNLIRKAIEENYNFAFSGDDSSLDEAIENGNVAKTERQAILGLIVEMRGWTDMQEYDDEKTQDGKIKLYQKACNFIGWEQNHTHLWNLKKELIDLED